MTVIHRKNEELLRLLSQVVSISRTWQSGTFYLSHVFVVIVLFVLYFQVESVWLVTQPSDYGCTEWCLILSTDNPYKSIFVQSLIWSVIRYWLRLLILITINAKSMNNFNWNFVVDIKHTKSQSSIPIILSIVTLLSFLPIKYHWSAHSRTHYSAKTDEGLCSERDTSTFVRGVRLSSPKLPWTQ